MNQRLFKADLQTPVESIIDDVLPKALALNNAELLASIRHELQHLIAVNHKKPVRHQLTPVGMMAMVCINLADYYQSESYKQHRLEEKLKGDWDTMPKDLKMDEAVEIGLDKAVDNVKEHVETLGEILRKHAEEQGLPIVEASKAPEIHPEDLQGIPTVGGAEPCPEDVEKKHFIPAGTILVEEYHINLVHQPLAVGTLSDERRERYITYLAKRLEELQEEMNQDLPLDLEVILGT